MITSISEGCPILDELLKSQNTVVFFDYVDFWQKILLFRTQLKSKDSLQSVTAVVKKVKCPVETQGYKKILHNSFQPIVVQNTMVFFSEKCCRILTHFTLEIETLGCETTPNSFWCAFKEEDQPFKTKRYFVADIHILFGIFLFLEECSSTQMILKRGNVW